MQTLMSQSELEHDMEDLKRDVEDEVRDLIERIKEKKTKRLSEFDEFLNKTADFLGCATCVGECLVNADNLDGKTTCLNTCKCYEIGNKTDIKREEFKNKILTYET